MTLTLDLTTDYTVWDDTTGVTWFRKLDGSEEAVYVATALKLPVSAREAASSGGVYTQQDVVWLVPGVLLGSRSIPDAGPKVGDTVKQEWDQYGSWTVLETSYSPLDRTWRLTCRNLAIAFDLQETITIIKPLNRQDAASGRVVVDWVPYKELKGKFQEMSGAPGDERGKRFTKTQYTVFLSERVSLRAEMLFEDESGKRYRYLSHEAPDRIDQLMTATVEAVT